jgi:hypothetical protein
MSVEPGNGLAPTCILYARGVGDYVLGDSHLWAHLKVCVPEGTPHFVDVPPSRILS